MVETVRSCDHTSRIEFPTAMELFLFERIGLHRQQNEVERLIDIASLDSGRGSCPLGVPKT
jgi:hypothetical protein